MNWKKGCLGNLHLEWRHVCESAQHTKVGKACLRFPNHRSQTRARMKPVVPVTAILPTRNRAPLLKRFLQSLHDQTMLPAEIVVCDGSDDDDTQNVVIEAQIAWSNDPVVWRYARADRLGLAPQRNQAVAAATQTFVWFLDDDVILEPLCLEHLHQVLASNENIGGVTATIVNQGYTAPGPFVGALMRWFEGGRARSTYAGSCIGPGWTFLPDTSREISPTEPAEWLIGCCSLYRKSALPVPAVPDHFEQGALGEDLAASLAVGQTHRLLHVRDACCYHDSQGGSHKRSRIRLADQGVRNRYFIMTQVMHRNAPGDHLQFVVMWLFTLCSLMRHPRYWNGILPNLAGYVIAAWKLCLRG